MSEKIYSAVRSLKIFVMKNYFVKIGLVLIVGANAFAQTTNDIAAELPKLAEVYHAATIVPFKPETTLSREYYQRLNRYVRYAAKEMRDWTNAPGARFHKVDYSAEHGVRQNADVALAFAVLSKLGDFDDKAAGTTRAQVHADAIGLIRYLSSTHVANFLPTGDGKKWGDHWQSAYWTASVGKAAWLLWDDLPDDVKVMCARMIVHEANRYNTRPPDNGEWLDTKAEENAWNSEAIALADCMFPQHPNAALWHERVIVYMMNAFSTAADHKDKTIVDGKPVKARVTTTCIHSDFTLDNHNRMHPDYLSTFTLNLRNALDYKMVGREIPRGTFHQAENVFKVFQTLTATNASLFYVNGQDWWPHRHELSGLVGGLMNVLRQDRHGAYLEHASLEFLGKMHARFDDGRMFNRCEHNYPNTEETMMHHYAGLYLAHRLFGDGVEPVEAKEFQRAQLGTRIFEAGGFVTHRTPEKFVSFAWANAAMGLIYPSENTWFTAPHTRGIVGNISIQGAKDSTPKVVQRKIVRLHLRGKTSDDGFAFVGKLFRCEDKVEQRLAIISLPDAPVLYVEQISARTNVAVKEIATATVAILNEDAKPIAQNQRHIWTAEGEFLARGAADAPAERLCWKTAWANVDDRLGIVTQGDGCFEFLAPHEYQHSRLQQELSPNYLADGGQKKSGEIISRLVAEFIPNASHEATPKTLRTEQLGETGVVISLENCFIAVNLGDKTTRGRAFGKKFRLAAFSAVVEAAR